ncbi:MAG TPA: flagellar protein FlaG, partial [bacterium]|nr:flagellar protein FlaG [bacterium]
MTTTKIQSVTQNIAYKQSLMKREENESQSSEVKPSLRPNKPDKEVPIIESLRPATESAPENQTDTTIESHKFNLYDSLYFQIHKETGQLMVVIKDVETGEVVKTVPPEELLNTLGNIKEAIGAII